jgi:hypothetical protein
VGPSGASLMNVNLKETKEKKREKKKKKRQER